MSSYNDLIDEIKSFNRDSFQFKQKCKKLSEDINSKKTTILQLIQNLENLLLDTSSESREIGVWILTVVFSYLEVNVVDSNQIIHIVTFYCDKLKDTYQIIPAALEGLTNLVNLQQLPEGYASKILRAIFNNIVCQQQQQKDRLCIYEIFEVLFKKYLDELTLMGIDLVYGVITAIDGERDPNNLYFIYNWIPKFFKVMDLKHLNEEAFEIFACYFPVDFKAPRQDPNAMTREKLSNSLAYCLTARPDFAQFCLPLALEKLESSLEIAQLDSLQLLEIGTLNFEVADYIRHFPDIWSKIYQNLIQDVPETVQVACLNTISRLIQKISDDSNLKNILKDILSCVNRNLDPESRFFTSTGNLLKYASRASKLSSEIISENVVPQLLNTFGLERNLEHKTNILKLLIDLLESYIHFHENIEFDDLKVIFVLCASVIESDEKSRILGYNSLAQFSTFLPEEIRLQAYKNLQRCIIQKQSSEARSAMENCFVILSKRFPSEIKENVISAIVATDADSIEFYLDALFLLLLQTDFQDYVMETFSKYLSLQDSVSEVAIKCLCNFLVKNESDDCVQTVIYDRKIVLQLINWAKWEKNVNVTTLEKISLIIKIVTGYQDCEKQKEILDNYYKKVCEDFQSVDEKVFIFLIDGICCRLRKNIEVDYSLFNFLTNIILNSSEEFNRKVALALLSNLINKCTNDVFLDNFLGDFENKFLDCENKSEVTAWITKSLLMRNHKNSEQWIMKMISLLKHDKTTASNFQIVLNDEILSLSTKSYCNKWLLYRQKFFVSVTDILTKAEPSEFDPSIMGYLLLHAPKPVVSLEFKKIFKLLVQSLEKCEQVEVLLILLECFKDRINEQDSVIEENANDVMRILLKLCLSENKMKVRIQTLQCLQAFTQLPLHKTIRFQNEVLSVLKKCVDDRKRFVRKEATEAVLLWTMIDATDAIS